MSDKAIALAAYETLADAYAAAIDTKPHNAYYERPATLSLLPNIENKTVLDAGCGPGVYAEFFQANGAKVIAFDVSPKMVALAQQRLGPDFDVRVADLNDSITFMDDASVDVVVCALVMDYVEDWRKALAEFHRVLRPAGHLIFSTTHPVFEVSYFKSDNYFEIEQVSTEWKGFHPVRVQMPSFRRPLQEIINPIIDTGFRLDKILEPKPTAEFAEADPKHYAELNKLPGFLCIRAVK